MAQKLIYFLFLIQLCSAAVYYRQVQLRTSQRTRKQSRLYNPIRGVISVNDLPRQQINYLRKEHNGAQKFFRTAMVKHWKPPTLMYEDRQTGGKLILGGIPTDTTFIKKYILQNNGISEGMNGNIPLYAINVLLDGIEQTGQPNDPSNLYSDLGISELRLNNPDHIEPSLSYIQAGVEFIEHYLSSRQNVYIHCKAGHGRSAAIVYAYLVKKARGKSLEEIQIYMSRKRKVRKNMFLQQNIRAFIRTLNRQDYAQEMSRTEAAARQALRGTQAKEKKKYGIILTYPSRRLPQPQHAGLQAPSQRLQPQLHRRNGVMGNGAVGRLYPGNLPPPPRRLPQPQPGQRYAGLPAPPQRLQPQLHRRNGVMGNGVVGRLYPGNLPPPPPRQPQLNRRNGVVGNGVVGGF